MVLCLDADMRDECVTTCFQMRDHQNSSISFTDACIRDKNVAMMFESADTGTLPCAGAEMRDENGSSLQLRRELW